MDTFFVSLLDTLSDPSVLAIGACVFSGLVGTYAYVKASVVDDRISEYECVVDSIECTTMHDKRLSAQTFGMLSRRIEELEDMLNKN